MKLTWPFALLGSFTMRVWIISSFYYLWGLFALHWVLPLPNSAWLSFGIFEKHEIYDVGFF